MQHTLYICEQCRAPTFLQCRALVIAPAAMYLPLTAGHMPPFPVRPPHTPCQHPGATVASKAKETLQQQPLHAPFTGPPGYTPTPSSSSSSKQDAPPAFWPGQGTAPTVFKAGDKLKQGRYQLKDKLLDGRFTSIWRATDQQKEGASVVVKVGVHECLDYTRYEHCVCVLQMGEDNCITAAHDCDMANITT
jgi:hypothetical protein